MRDQARDKLLDTGLNAIRSLGEPGPRSAVVETVVNGIMQYLGAEWCVCAEVTVEGRVKDGPPQQALADRFAMEQGDKVIEGCPKCKDAHPGNAQDLGRKDPKRAPCAQLGDAL